MRPSASVTPAPAFAQQRSRGDARSRRPQLVHCGRADETRERSCFAYPNQRRRYGIVVTVVPTVCPGVGVRVWPARAPANGVIATLTAGRSSPGGTEM